MGSSLSKKPLDAAVRGRLRSKGLLDEEIMILWNRFQRLDKDNDGLLKYSDLESTVSGSDSLNPLKERVILAFMNYSKQGIDRLERKSRAIITFEQWALQLNVWNMGSSQDKMSFLYRLFNDYSESELGRNSVESLLFEFREFLTGNPRKTAREYIEAAQRKAGKTVTGESLDKETFMAASLNPVQGNPLNLDKMMYLRLFRPGFKPIFEACCGYSSSTETQKGQEAADVRNPSSSAAAIA